MRGRNAPGEFLVGSEGKARRLAVVVTPLDSAGGRIVLLHDITEAQELRTQAARNQRLAAMGEMAAQLAHQLRTPLAAALLYTGNLENPDIPTATRVSIAQKAVSRLQHLERLIQDMLLFAGAKSSGVRSFPLPNCCLTCVRRLSPSPARARVLLAVSDRSAGGLVIGNRKSLTGALTNLLENALHAAPGASERGLVPTVSLSAETIMSNDEGAATWQIRITDNGPGMDADTAARLFEPFFTTRTEGTGLGLAIARGVARAHGGAIDVVSSPGNGAEFILTLPCPLPTKP
jgi:two-component system sensor histidine kinase FlrB